MTDEIDEVRAQDATGELDLPPAIARLGIEARAEYIRARQRLGLIDEASARLEAVGRYRLEAEIGRGGMGIVYRARDPELDRPVAIKLVQAVPLVRYDKLRARLLKEAKVLAKLNHPNVVQVYDCGQHEGEVYLAMEYVEGTTLRDWQRGQSRRSILDAYQQAALGLAAAHDLGIIHRDCKPDNVLVASDGRVLVGDFGLAGLIAGDVLLADRTDGSHGDASTHERMSATRSGALLGTLAYMAPEQLRGDGVTPRSDQFAFCVALWEALTGVRPFAGEEREGLLGEIERGRIRGSGRIPRRLRGRLARGLAADPERRFGGMRELAEGLVPRRGRGVLASALSLSLAVGLVTGMWLREPTFEPCSLEGSVANMEEMRPQWRQLEERLTEAGLRRTYQRLESLHQGMRVEAEELCRPGGNDEIVARQQNLKTRVEHLRSILQRSKDLDLASLQGEIDRFEAERWSAPPPRPLKAEVVQLLLISYPLRLNNHLPEALYLADRAVEAAGDEDLELAFALRWRGDVLAFMDKRHEHAYEAYRKAAGHADAAAYDDARLDNELLAAKIAVMRLGDLDRARESLNEAHSVLRRLREPWISPRRADYHEVTAAVLKREGNLDGALAYQIYALLVRGWWGDRIEIGRGSLNLATILEHRGSDPALVYRNYKGALDVLEPLSSSPEWLAAAVGFGRWLAQNDDDKERARELLEAAASGPGDMQISALTELLWLAISENDPPAASAWAKKLEPLLNNSSSLSAERSLDAWQNVAIGHAMGHDLAAFENARSCFDRVAQEALRKGSLLIGDSVEQQTAQLDLMAAGELVEVAPDRAQELATSVRGYLLRRVEAKELPKDERQRLLSMLEAAESLIP
ncbi:protein kinase domain-containing protein [Paraliomyxa miuraensis]|uniref:protein kinase domain-containing protein n=1 Tax=Paraliomyxa miuraensis TaxID=376150 RepID=UPI0022599887|nr:protein kinase [Paraliomyxa miuraensis]MCX4243942.1 protein kinase [Paraliomyxa miuraensis]